MPEVRLSDDHANLDDYTAYLRRDAEKSKELALLKDEIIVATRQESDDAQIAMAKNVNADGLTKEQRDYRDMAQRTSIGNVCAGGCPGARNPRGRGIRVQHRNPRHVRDGRLPAGDAARPE